MRPKHFLVAVLALALGLVALVTGCSGDNKTATNPPVVTGPTFNFTFPQTGTSHEITITDVGSWGYVCTTHSPGMAGTITVTAAAADSALVQVGPSNSLTFSPATVTIKPGGKVRWVNASSMTNHTATR